MAEQILGLTADQIKFLLKNIQSFSVFAKFNANFLYDSVTSIPSYLFRNLIEEQSKIVLFDLLNGRNGVRFMSTTIAKIVHLRKVQ